MHLTAESVDAYLDRVTSVSAPDASLYKALDDLRAPVYVTDPQGFVQYFNRACIGFTGRLPAVGKDRWCVTWKLYSSDGDYLPHEQCPMAEAIRSGRRIRGMTAVAGRPDGTRVRFAPFPTPIFDAAGRLICAVNVLLDITDDRQAAELEAEAQRCRRLGSSMKDELAICALEDMALDFESKARALSSLQATQ